MVVAQRNGREGSVFFELVSTLRWLLFWSLSFYSVFVSYRAGLQMTLRPRDDLLLSTADVERFSYH